MIRSAKIALHFVLDGNESAAQLARLLSSVMPYMQGALCSSTQPPPKAILNELDKYAVSYLPVKATEDQAAIYNELLKNTPEDFPYIFWLRPDEVLSGGERLCDLVDSKPDIVRLNCQVLSDLGLKLPLEQFSDARLFKRALFNWTGRVFPKLMARRQSNIVQNEMITIQRRPDAVAFLQNSEGRRKNYKLLRSLAKDSSATLAVGDLFGLAVMCFEFGDLNSAQRYFRAYLSCDGRQDYRSLRAQAFFYLASISRITNQIDDAKACLFSAIDEEPAAPTWYIQLGALYATLEEWDKSEFWLSQGRALSWPYLPIPLAVLDDTCLALCVQARAYEKKGKFQEALACMREANLLKGADLDLLRQESAIEKNLKAETLIQGVGELAQTLAGRNDTVGIEKLFASLPDEIDSTPRVAGLKNLYLPPKKWPGKTIIYFCGSAMEPWDETSLTRGIGGSETAVIHLSQAWAKCGYQVYVFGSPLTEHTDACGVHWLNYWRLSPRDQGDIFICWRSVDLFDQGVKARLRVLDCHDVLHSEDFDAKRLGTLDLILVKSSFHRGYIPNVPDERVRIIPNGLALPLPDFDEAAREPQRLVYSHSYDRGLEPMLRYGWPIIRNEIPAAELHIYYGWNTFDKVCGKNPERRAWRKSMEQLLSQPGIFDHGRIGQDELLREKAKSTVHYYGCTFPEIDCIAIRESAAVGCIPVTTDFAALTGKPYALQIQGDARAEATQQKLALEIVRLLSAPQELDARRKQFMELARAESWKNAAQQWIEQVFSARDT